MKRRLSSCNLLLGPGRRDRSARSLVEAAGFDREPWRAVCWACRPVEDVPWASADADGSERGAGYPVEPTIFLLQSGQNHLFGQLNLEARAARARLLVVLQKSNSELRISIKVHKTIFKSTLRTVDAVESVSYCVQQDGKSSRTLGKVI